MKVLMINGSPRSNSNTGLALNEMVKIFDKENIEHEIIQIGNKDIRGCLACNYCYKNGKCVVDDIVNEVALKFKEADALVVGTPVYYAGTNGTVVSFLDRLFYSSNFDKTMKVGAAVAIARRGGCTTALDEINRYFSISGMPICASQYWNMAYGRKVGEASLDEEGMQIMRTLANDMVFLMKSIALGKEKYGLPIKEKHVSTNFIR